MASKATSRERMYLKMVVSSLVRRSSRLIVAVLAIAIGATTLSGLVTIYYDIPRQLGREFRSYGANLVLLPRGDTKILRRDLEEVRRIIGGDRIVGMAPYRSQTVKINEQPTSSQGPTWTRLGRTAPSGMWRANGGQRTVPTG